MFSIPSLPNSIHCTFIVFFRLDRNTRWRVDLNKCSITGEKQKKKRAKSRKKHFFQK
nr:MAG TPA: hypothetical protein [Caudoviricetes sp.]